MNEQIKEELRQRSRNVKLLMLDVDGVLTDGRIIYDSSGRDLKFFDVHDGLGVHLLEKAGIPTVLITAKGSETIKPRAQDMRVAGVYENVSPKTAALTEILARHRVDADEICFVGDDLVDICLMKRVGLPVAVFNACPDVKQHAAYITLKTGGRGAVREVAELILKSQDKWRDVLAEYDI